MKRHTFWVLALAIWATPATAQTPISLKASDELTVTGDVYRARTEPNAPWIVLAHQAGASRGEYRTIAPRLNKLGFNAIAIDQRSGRTFAGVRNNTAVEAKRKRKARTYLAARPDIDAAIAWARNETTGKVILMGSSYSAALALLMAGEAPDLVDGIVSNSPGEYLKGKSVSRAAANIKVPVLITSPPREAKRWRKIFKNIPGDKKVDFAPKRGGVHGSSAFIAARNKSSEVFWNVLEAFLTKYGLS